MHAGLWRALVELTVGVMYEEVHRFILLRHRGYHWVPSARKASRESEWKSRGNKKIIGAAARRYSTFLQNGDSDAGAFASEISASRDAAIYVAGSPSGNWAIGLSRREIQTSVCFAGAK